MDRNRQSLVTTDLCGWYEAPPKRVEVFWGVSLSVAPGEILGVVGPNGSGKTTLMRAIAGLHRTYTGEVTLPGGDRRHTRLAVVPQAFVESFFPWASLRFNVFVTSRQPLTKWRDVFRRVDEMRVLFGSDVSFKLRPPECSGGMVQQAALIRALVPVPDLLIADEPFSALDVSMAARFRQALRAFVQREQIVALLVDHDLSTIAAICDKVLVIPGKPFSSRSIGGYERIEIIENALLGRLCGPAAARSPGINVSFVDMVRNVVRPGRSET